MVTEAGERDLFPAFLYVYVDDADATYERAVAAGASTIEAPLDTPYGDRRAMVRDPFGNVYQIAHRADREQSVASDDTSNLALNPRGTADAYGPAMKRNPTTATEPPPELPRLLPRSPDPGVSRALSARPPSGAR